MLASGASRAGSDRRGTVARQRVFQGFILTASQRRPIALQCNTRVSDTSQLAELHRANEGYGATCAFRATTRSWISLRDVFFWLNKEFESGDE